MGQRRFSLGAYRWCVSAVAMLMLAGCANPFATAKDSDETTRQQIVYANPNTLIGLAPDRDAASAKANGHPATFNRLDMAYLLRDVRVALDGSRQRGLFGRQGARQVKLFTRASIKRLAGPLASALGKAGPKQDVVVYIEQAPQVVGDDGTINVGQLAEASRVSSARLFVRGQKLHIIAGAVGINPKADSNNSDSNLGRGDLTLDRLKKVAPVGTRARPRDQTGALSGRFARNREGEGRPDWLVVDYPRLLASVATQRPDDGSAALEAIDYEPTEVRGGPTVQDVESAPAERSRDERLDTLERLRRDGVISESEYQRRKAEIDAATDE